MNHSLNRCLEITNTRLSTEDKYANIIGIAQHRRKFIRNRKPSRKFRDGENRSQIRYEIFEQMVFTGMYIRFSLIINATKQKDDSHVHHLTRPEQFGAKSVSLPAKSARDTSGTIRCIFLFAG